ncbi:hypothetical protein ACFSC6_11640 [Rufibacter sediminis]|uniref:hypothetical protein n=1 Tax=Rufibacter sediminis TaxID=2762756 RepID=UPI00210B2BE0|nr:hypothetical protein [Rufibacter sediminis]
MITCFLPVGLVFAQSIEEEEGYSREFTYGLNFNSNGGLLGGAMIKQVYHMDGKWYQFWALEGVEVKHEKENPVQNLQNGASFVRGKSNYLFVLRPQYGREYTFFRKAAESGVQVNGILAAGPSLGILAPYFIDYDRSNYVYDQNTQRYYLSGPVIISTEQFNPDIHNNESMIVGAPGVFKGLSEPSFRVGAHAKAGVSFEYGRYMESVTGIEVGMLVETFAGDMTMIPEAPNRNLFTSVYLTLYYGRRR